MPFRGNKCCRMFRRVNDNRIICLFVFLLIMRIRMKFPCGKVNDTGGFSAHAGIFVCLF